MKNVIHQLDSKNEWLLLSASFTAKFGLVFDLTLETRFLRGLILKPTERAQVLLKNCTRDFQKIGMFLCDNQWEFERFQTLKHLFWKTKTFFKKTGVQFHS